METKSSKRKSKRFSSLLSYNIVKVSGFAVVVCLFYFVFVRNTKLLEVTAYSLLIHYWYITDIVMYLFHVHKPNLLHKNQKQLESKANVLFTVWATPKQLGLKYVYNRFSKCRT